MKQSSSDDATMNLATPDGTPPCGGAAASVYSAGIVVQEPGADAAATVASERPTEPPDAATLTVGGAQPPGDRATVQFASHHEAATDGCSLTVSRTFAGY